MKRLFWFILIVGFSYDVSKASECVSRGRYPNNDEVDCRGYTMCLPMGGAFMQYKLTCPLGSVYSHSEQTCTTATTYTCLSNYTCNSTGDFEDPEAENCVSYVTCVMGLVDMVAARRVECPVNQTFSPRVGCVNMTGYVCIESIETTTVTDVVDIKVAVENASVQFSREFPVNSGGVVRSSLFIVVVCCVIKYI